VKDFLSEKRAEIESALQMVLRPEPGLPQSLLEAMRYSLLAPGKRLRPLLVVLAAEVCGGTATRALPAACAVEMIHTYSLIHDDLPAMDDDDLRRGVPTCHKRFGEALGILAGDALLTFAFQVLSESYPGRLGATSCRELARAAGPAGMVGGQVDDLAWERMSHHTLEGLEQLHLRKTGALIRASLRLGTYVAQHHKPDALASALDEGANAEQLRHLDGYGRCLGLAFQITDDLLDVEGQSDNTGKRVVKDAARGKLTYPGLLGIAQSRQRARALGEQALEHLAPFGAPAEPLRHLVALVLQRDR
jgi:geranylgeranyl diphosphate synthase type II